MHYNLIKLTIIFHRNHKASFISKRAPLPPRLYLLHALSDVTKTRKLKQFLAEKDALQKFNSIQLSRHSLFSLTDRRRHLSFYV